MSKHYFVYIIASQKDGTLYVGMTNDLVRRVLEHRQKIIEGFSQKYGVYKLVYPTQYELFRVFTLRTFKLLRKIRNLNYEEYIRITIFHLENFPSL